MRSRMMGTDSELIRLAACSFMGAFLLFSTVGCEQETVNPTDITFSSEDNIATVYVDAAIGSDDYNGLSQICLGTNVGPKQTIQAGVDITPNGGICKVASGEYREQIAMAEGVTLAGAGAAVTFIDGGNKRGNVINIKNCNVAQTVVRGFTIRNGSCYGDNAGIRIQYSSDVVIRNNVITANRADGIRVYSASPRIINNTIAGNGRNGIMSHNEAQPEIVNNIIVDNNLLWPASCEYGWGLYASSCAVINCSYNNIWKHNNNYGIETEGICSPGIGDISINPMFVDTEGDFHLSAGSPCIDAGVYVGLEYHGGAPDMGAFEYKRQ
ncbi:MAG: right-handed parallel beta-helix repeat-containing protein [Candidatus Krumholzibacteriota bacterium]|nr:right-handed parallel beta-helix repeat-containing protein [Candidatus Krumholzibacteriota bacterium]